MQMVVTAEERKAIINGIKIKKKLIPSPTPLLSNSESKAPRTDNIRNNKDNLHIKTSSSFSSINSSTVKENPNPSSPNYIAATPIKQLNSSKASKAGQKINGPHVPWSQRIDRVAALEPHKPSSPFWKQRIPLSTYKQNEVTDNYYAFATALRKTNLTSPKAQTGDALTDLKAIFDSLPEDDGEQLNTTQPKELLVQLLGHQVKGLSWLKGDKGRRVCLNRSLYS